MYIFFTAEMTVALELEELVREELEETVPFPLTELSETLDVLEELEEELELDELEELV